jgi:hypothetical protein
MPVSVQRLLPLLWEDHLDTNSPHDSVDYEILYIIEEECCKEASYPMCKAISDNVQ